MRCMWSIQRGASLTFTGSAADTSKFSTLNGGVVAGGSSSIVCCAVGMMCAGTAAAAAGNMSLVCAGTAATGECRNNWLVVDCTAAGGSWLGELTA